MHYVNYVIEIFLQTYEVHTVISKRGHQGSGRLCDLLEFLLLGNHALGLNLRCMSLEPLSEALHSPASSAAL